MDEILVTVKQIHECAHVIPTLAEWFDKAFAHEGCVESEERQWLERSLSYTGGFPMTFVAFNGDTPIGTIRLFDGDMTDRPQYSVWVGYALVLPEHRRLKAFDALHRKLIEHAISLKIPRLYCYIPIEERSWWINHLLKFGWKEKESRGWDLHENGWICEYIISTDNLDSNELDKIS